MDFGYNEDCFTYFLQETKIVTYLSGDVSNRSEWGDWIKKKYSPVRIKWSNDEMAPYGTETINLYGWEKIITDILNRTDKTVLTTLLTVNNADLTELISQRLIALEEIEKQKYKE